jgi:SAM-dependent methyltransferase
MVIQPALLESYEERARLYRAHYLVDAQAAPSTRSGWRDRAAQYEAYDVIAAVTERSGLLLDLGCANGMLLSHLSAVSGGRLIPHGVDFLPELIDEARTLLPRYAGNLHVGNIETFALPHATFVYVITNPLLVLPAARVAYVRRCLDALALGGALILVQYVGGFYFGRPDKFSEALALPAHQVVFSAYAQLHILFSATL